jgi:peptide/nickel transport system ATP-binding protein/oligopeptide transport system ATP-binding protein
MAYIRAPEHQCTRAQVHKGASEREGMEELLKVNELSVNFAMEGHTVQAVVKASFAVKKGEIFSLVGESGCGKTLTALSIMGLVPEPGRVISEGIIFSGKDLGRLSREEIREIRGNEIAMVFQEPMVSFNPLYTIGYQIAEAIGAHQQLAKDEVRKRTLRALSRVEMPFPEGKVNDYPHQLSGGMKQRAMIAMAIVNSPQLLIADEPTTALDVTIQAQILKLFLGLRDSTNMSIILITHDLGIVAEIADRVAVMYAGEIVENASVYKIFNGPLHPYSQGLLGAIPGKIRGRLLSIPGDVPDPRRRPAGCPFHPRCPQNSDICKEKTPLLKEVEEGHWVKCHEIG